MVLSKFYNEWFSECKVFYIILSMNKKGLYKKTTPAKANRIYLTASSFSSDADTSLSPDIFVNILQIPYPISAPHVFVIRSSTSVARKLKICVISMSREKIKPVSVVLLHFLHLLKIRGSKNPKGIHITIFRTNPTPKELNGTKLYPPIRGFSLMRKSLNLKISPTVPTPVTWNTIHR